MGRLADRPAPLTITVTIDEDLRGSWISGVTQRRREDLYIGPYKEECGVR